MKSPTAGQAAIFCRAASSSSDTLPEDASCIQSVAVSGADLLRQDSADTRRHFEHALDRLQRSATLDRLVSGEVSRLAHDGAYIPERVVPGRLSLYENADCRLDLVTTRTSAEQPSTFLYSNTTSLVHVSLDDSACVSISAYQAPRVERNDTFVAGAKLELIEQRNLDRYHAIRASADGLTAHDLCSDRPSVLLRLALKRELPFVWGFDREVLAAKFYYPSDVGASRRALAIDFLLATSHPRLAELCSLLRASQWHFLRWRAIQVMAREGFATVDELMHAACDDNHPEIRSAARDTLDQMAQA